MSTRSGWRPRQRRTSAAVLAGCLGLITVTVGHASAPASAGTEAPPAANEPGTDQLLITTVSGEGATAATAAAGGLTVAGERPLTATTSVVKLTRRLGPAEAAAVARRIERFPGVVSVEPDVLVFPTLTPNDPSFGSQWDLAAPVPGNYGAGLPAAWDITTGSAGIVVAVLDTGYLDHVDLAGRFVGGYDFIGDALVGNDGNGRDGDAHDPGDWITNAESAAGHFAGCDVDNSSWHGTHVSGTIGAATNNATGVAGINWVSKILPVRVLGKCGGYLSDIVDAMRWSAGLAVTGVPANPNPADVINLSLGGSDTCSGSMQSAIDDAVNAGATVVIAAGNSNANASGFTPGNCNNVVTVSATGKAGNRASYSNYGAMVEIAAPGGDAAGGILSTLNTGTQGPVADSYVNYQGTSMATPHVAGVVSLMLSADPTLTPTEVLAILQSSATTFPAGSTCTTVTCGAGILNAAIAVASAAGALPDAPTGLTATPGNGQVGLTWTAPADPGDTAITDYRVQRSTDGLTWTTVSDGVSTTTSAAVTGLTNGTQYRFRVAAINTAGTGPNSAEVLGTPRTVPGAPTGLAAAAGNSQVALTWTGPAVNGGSPITDYLVQFSTDGTNWTTFVDAVSSVASTTVTGLTNGSAHQFRVAAVNAAGTGSTSAITNATPATVPGAPSTPDPTPGNSLVGLAWTAPAATGGSPITDYVVQRSTDGVSWTTFVDGVSTNTTTAVTGLVNGTEYRLRVAAVNAMGTGPFTSEVLATPFGPPPAPTGLAATAGDSQVSLTWTAPGSDGGSPITDYAVEHSTNGVNWTLFSDGVSTATSATVTGLTNGTSYQFRVSGTNGAGVGTASSTASTTPRTVPGTPTALAATPGNTQVGLTWTAPANNGGAAITDYVVQSSPDGTTWTTFADDASSAPSATVTGLVNGSGYQFRVAAINIAGAGSYSTHTLATPRTTPNAPTALVATAGIGQAGLTWTAPASDGGAAITDYVIQHSTNGVNWTTFTDGTSPTTAATVTGLASGIVHQFRVAAVNAAGPGPNSTTASTTPFGPPGTPTALTATPGNTQINLTWTAPANTGGSPITDYVVQHSTNGVDWTTFNDGTSAATSATVTGLVNGTTYTLRVTAINIAGPGPTSGTATATPRTVPDAPTTLTATPAHQSIGLTWVAPANTGGAAITDYVIQSSPDGTTWTTFNDGTSTTTATTVTGLTNGTTYTLRVAAINTAGAGAYSTHTLATPRTTPNAPTALVATASIGQAGLTWTAPASDGGATITDYVIQHSTNGVNWTTFTDGTSPTTATTVTGLASGIVHQFRVAAVNAAGPGPNSTTASTTPYGPPGMPTALTATPANQTVGLAWTAPTNTGGTPITDYLIEHSPDGTTWTTFNDGTSSATSATVTGLANGTTYTLRVAAINIAGPGPTSGTATATPRTVPDAPTTLTATPAHQSIGLTWVAPANTGGAPITDYLIQSSPDGTTWTTFNDGPSTTTSATVTGLTNGTTYTLRVAAINAAGPSSYSTHTLATPRTTPNAPTALVATAGIGQAGLTWTAPASDGGAAITDYVIQHSTNGVNWTTFTDGTSPTTAATVTGLASGIVHQFRVAAVNAAGPGPNSTTASTTPFGPPGTPTALTATPGNTQINLTWTAPANTGGSPITDYVVQHSTNGVDWTTFNDGTSAATSATVTGLVNGTTYTLRVTAINIAGPGPTSGTASATPRTVPDAPTTLTATPAHQSIGLTWVAPANTGGAAITDYVIQSSPDGTTWTTFNDGPSTTTSATVTGLTNGTTYTLRVAAINAAGPSTYSTHTLATPRTIPGAPTGLTATPGVGQAALSWAAPVSDGGAPITDYTVEHSTNGTTWTTFDDGVAATTATTVTGLTNGTTYQLRITATNIAGPGSASSAVNATPRTVPDAPTNFQAVPGNQSVGLTWTAPTNTGGAPITDYLIEHSTDGTTWTTVNDGPSTTTTATVTGLVNGTIYTLRVTAINAAGSGAPSSTTPATPMAVPTSPTGLIATPGPGNVALTWTSPTDQGGSPVTDFVVDYSTDGTNWTTFTDGVSTDTSTTVTALVNGTVYQFRVAGVNSVGTGLASGTASATPRTVPGSPAGLIASPGNGLVALTWTTPGETGGAPITDYLIEHSTNATTWTTFNDSTSTTTTTTVTGLTNGTTYQLRVTAINIAGPGATSSIVPATPRTSPGAPTDVTTTPGHETVTLSWTAPTDTGGAPITDYLIEHSTNGTTWTTFNDGTSTTTAATVTGLTNGITYQLRVTAVNAAGPGPASTSTSTTPHTVPDAPTTLTATPGNQSVTLSWSVPTDTGGAPITDYLIQHSTNATTWTTFNDGTSTTTTTTVTGLTNGTTYQLRVTAVNAAGPGPASTSTSTTPHTVPDAPTTLTATPGNQSVTLSWSVPADAGGAPITDYLIQHSTNATTWTTFNDGTSTTTTTTVTGLTNGTTYQLRVTAVNAAGPGPASTSTSTTPHTVPDAPTTLTATPGNQSVTLSWSVPTDTGGAPITDYLIQHSTNATTWTTFNDGTSTTTTTTVTGLTNGTTYQLRVTAVNGAGSGPSSTPTAATPRTTPGEPTELTTTPGNTQIGLTWTAPTDTGGAPITDYLIEHSTNGTTWTTFNDGTSTTTTTTTVTGLTNGTTYQLRVTAINAAGPGVSSALALSTPLAVPGAPIALTATAGNSEAALHWQAPADDGGSPVIDYLIERSPNGGATWVTVFDGASPVTAYTVTGLSNGALSTFRVSAINSEGMGPASLTAAATPFTSPGVPLWSSALPRDGSVVLVWTVPDTGGAAVVDHLVQHSTDGVTWSTVPDGVSPAPTVTVSGLLPGVLHRFRIAAVNPAGQGPFGPVTSASLPPGPSVLPVVALTPQSGSIRLAWTPPTAPGAPIVDYVIQRARGAGNWTTIRDGRSVVTHYTARGLTNGTGYRFRVAAVTSLGQGPWSVVTTAVPRTLPGAPRSLSLAPGSGQVRLTWRAPSRNGGAAVLDYRIQISLNGRTWTTLADGVGVATTFTATGLTNGLRYRFRVAAINAAGTGPNSGSRSATPRA